MYMYVMFYFKLFCDRKLAEVNISNKSVKLDGNSYLMNLKEPGEKFCKCLFKRSSLICSLSESIFHFYFITVHVYSCFPYNNVLVCFHR